MMNDIEIHLFSSEAADELGIKSTNIGFSFAYKGIPYGSYITLYRGRRNEEELKKEIRTSLHEVLNCALDTIEEKKHEHEDQKESR